MPTPNGNTVKWVAAIITAALGCTVLGYTIGSNTAARMAIQIEGLETRMRLVETDTATLKALMPGMRTDIAEMKLELKEIKALLQER